MKNAVAWTYVINQKEFRIEKLLKKKEINYMSNGKNITTDLIAGLVKKIL